MPVTQNTITLSRYFYDNVIFVANICPKCYEESEDLKIISINLQFLKQINTIKEKKYIKKIPWVPPKSPHNLIEEYLYNNPWGLLVATIFLNKTSCITARPYIFWFLTDNPDPLTVLNKFPSDLEKYFFNLGLVKTRVIQIYRMSYDFLFKQWKSVKELYGIGDYGECAYRMFCLGDFNVEPKDRFLKIYKEWYKKFHKDL